MFVSNLIHTVHEVRPSFGKNIYYNSQQIVKMNVADEPLETSLG